jgi:hypothetical protein
MSIKEFQVLLIMGMDIIVWGWHLHVFEGLSLLAFRRLFYCLEFSEIKSIKIIKIFNSYFAKYKLFLSLDDTYVVHMSQLRKLGNDCNY